jgi:fatty acid desaturase
MRGHQSNRLHGYTNRRLNEFIGEILALPTSTSMAGYRNSHFAHHRELNSENDPDWQRNVGLKEYEFPAPPGSVLMRIMQYLSGLKTVTAVTGFHKKRVRAMLRPP